MAAKKIAIMNTKGGVAKSTTAWALCGELNRRGYRTLLVDTDQNKGSTMLYNAKTEGEYTLYDLIFTKGVKIAQCIQHTDQGDIVPCDELLTDADTKIPQSPKMYRYLSKAFQDIENDYDFIIIDSGQRRSLLGNMIMAADYVIFPVKCDLLSTGGFASDYALISEFEEDSSVKILGILRTVYSKRETNQKRIEGVIQAYGDAMNTSMFNATIRKSAACEQAQALSIGLAAYAPKAGVTEDYAAFADECLARISKMEGETNG